MRRARLDEVKIVGIGTDIVSVDRVRAVVERYADAFPRKILNAEEMSAYRSSTSKAAYLSRRFAAKEAVAKALGTGLTGIGLKDIVITHDPLGKPLVSFTANAKQKLGAHDLLVHISISDERDYAVAFAIAVAA